MKSLPYTVTKKSCGCKGKSIIIRGGFACIKNEVVHFHLRFRRDSFRSTSLMTHKAVGRVIYKKIKSTISDSAKCPLIASETIANLANVPDLRHRNGSMPLQRCLHDNRQSGNVGHQKCWEGKAARRCGAGIVIKLKLS